MYVYLYVHACTCNFIRIFTPVYFIPMFHLYISKGLIKMN